MHIMIGYNSNYSIYTSQSPLSRSPPTTPFQLLKSHYLNPPVLAPKIQGGHVALLIIRNSHLCHTLQMSTLTPPTLSRPTLAFSVGLNRYLVRLLGSAEYQVLGNTRYSVVKNLPNRVSKNMFLITIKS